MVETIRWTDAGVVMIDQTRLPREQVFVTCRTYREVAEAIRSMVIRGAPAIGVAAAMGVALGAQEDADFETVCETLAQTRPTAVNLFWAIDRMRRLEGPLNGVRGGGVRRHKLSINYGTNRGIYRGIN
jgi:methylthioribose-1-phosphate isomerase